MKIKDDLVKELAMKEVEEKMVNGDALTTPIEFALRKTMKEFEKSDDKNDKIIYEGLRRSMAVWESIKIRTMMTTSMIQKMKLMKIQIPIMMMMYIPDTAYL